LFGIKAGASWNGAAVSVPTLEFESGLPVRKVERFRSYESAAASFRDYAGMLSRSPRYAAAVGTGGDVTAFASALQQGGYATDPNYAHKVTALASEVRSIAAAGAFKSSTAMPLQSLERKSS
jgi:flagellar protein FlgJ